MKIEVRKVLSVACGGCTSCTDASYFMVWELKIGNFLIRVCEDCRKELMKQLREVK